MEHVRQAGRTASFQLRGKNILILSPQRWGTMRVSKHHYAAELARRDNRVFFVNPPDAEADAAFRIERDQDAGVEVVTYRPLFPQEIRFHARRLFDLLMRGQVAALLEKLGRVDVVWCFDPFTFGKLRAFGAERVIYHIVDQVTDRHTVPAARAADVIISVAPEILERFDGIPSRRLLINHGIAEPFATRARRRLEARNFARQPTGPVQFGYVGNLLIPSLGRSELVRVVSENPDVEFHFWGAHRLSQSNIAGDGSDSARRFIATLLERPNARLHGPKAPEQLADEIQTMDGFLVCYDVARDFNGGSNTHKMLEYLSTGKVIVSSRITAYDSHRNLLCMSQRDDGADYPELFRAAVSQLEALNRPEVQEARIRLALENTYSAHLDKIEAVLRES